MTDRYGVTVVPYFLLVKVWHILRYYFLSIQHSLFAKGYMQGAEEAYMGCCGSRWEPYGMHLTF